MPRIKLTLPGSGTPWTKVPNVLIDSLMPNLRDTELRVLLALVRGTTGWNREGRTIPMTYRRLILLTGRRSEAVGKALASLRERGLVHTPDAGARRFPKPRASESGGQHTKTEG